MEISRVSSYYFFACNRVHDVMDELYEALHDLDGTPNTDLESVIDVVANSRKQIYEELDMIKSIVAEYEDIQSSDNT